MLLHDTTSALPSHFGFVVVAVSGGGCGVGEGGVAPSSPLEQHLMFAAPGHRLDAYATEQVAVVTSQHCPLGYFWLQRVDVAGGVGAGINPATMSPNHVHPTELFSGMSYVRLKPSL